jgi:hypothetical protein
MVAANQHRHARPDPGRLCRRFAAAPAALSPSRRCEEAHEIDAFGAELIDRFGPMPEEVQHLSRSSTSRDCAARRMSRRSMPVRKASLCQFRNSEFANPAGLVVLHRGAGCAGQDPAGPESGSDPRLGKHRQAFEGHGDDPDQSWRASLQSTGGGLKPFSHSALNHSELRRSASETRRPGGSVRVSIVPLTAASRTHSFRASRNCLLSIDRPTLEFE